MAFNQLTFDKISDQTRGIFDRYIYRTDDSVVDLMSPNYFKDVRFDLSKGVHLLEALCSDGISTLDISKGEVKIVPINSTISGWASYIDVTNQTSENALSLPANTWVDLPNDAGFVIDSQKPADVDAFYSNGLIQGRSGDAFAISIFLCAICTSILTTKIKMAIDIGGDIGIIFIEDFEISGIVNDDKNITYDVSAPYMLDTFEANGGKVKIMSVGGTTNVHGMQYNFQRTHKAR